MKTKTFQKQDLARAALHDGLILAWDTGLGKTWALFLWPLLKLGYARDPHSPTVQPKGAVLILAPGDLHAQIRREGREHFHIEVTPIETQADFLKLASREDGTPRLAPDGRPVLPPGFYITSYTQLSINGVLRPPDPDDCDPRELLDRLSIPLTATNQSRLLPEHVPTAAACPFTTEDVKALLGNHARERTPKLYQWFAELDEDTKREVVKAAMKGQLHPRLMETVPVHPSIQHPVIPFWDRRGKKWEEHYGRLNFSPEQTIADLDKRMEAARASAYTIDNAHMRDAVLTNLEESYAILSHLCCHKPRPLFTDLSQANQDFVLRAFLKEYLTDGTVGDGTVHRYPIGPAPEGYHPAKPETDTRLKWAVKCVYSPSLADLCYRAFDCVVIDEGVKMKGTDTYVGLAVRSLTPRFRLVLTATPVKNRLRDIFWLCWWAAGGSEEATARWPYRNDESECERFAREFMVSERNKSKEEASAERGQFKRFEKLTAEVCNVHRLWKLLGPIVLRRRKQDAGEDIVPKIRKVVRCELGRQQKRVYEYHLRAEYLDKTGMEAIGAKLQSLRMAAADPASEHLPAKSSGAFESCTPCLGKGYLDPEKPQSTCPHCRGKGQLELPHRSHTSYTPKLATTLQLIQEIVARQEQVVVFSAFNDPLDVLSRRLHEADVRHITLDGRCSQKKRGDLGAIFKRGRYQLPGAALTPDAAIPVMLAGVECMAEGHSFHLANNVILIAYSWAYDKFIQAINRVHRMTSPKPVNVYVVIANGTIDRRLESLIQEKGDAAELVLDGQLMGERQEEVNLAELLKIARKEFNTQDNTIDEARLEQDWPGLRDALRTAHQLWHHSAPVREITTTSNKKTMKPKPRFDTSKVQFTAPRRSLTPAAEPSNIIPLDGPVSNIVPLPLPARTPATADNSRAAWMARMRKRAATLSQIQRADVGFEAL